MPGMLQGVLYRWPRSQSQRGPDTARVGGVGGVKRIGNLNRGVENYFGVARLSRDVVLERGAVQELSWSGWIKTRDRVPPLALES